MTKGNIKKTLLILSCLFTSLLMVSTATALPVATSEPVMDLVEEQEQMMELNTQIQSIINSDKSFLEKKEGLLQLINDLDISNNPQSTSAIGPFLLLLPLVLFLASINFVMMSLYPIWIPIDVILSIFSAVVFTIVAIDLEYISNPFEYILNFFFWFILSFILGPPFSIVMIQEFFEPDPENSGFLTQRLLTEKNLLPLNQPAQYNHT